MTSNQSTSLLLFVGFVLLGGWAQAQTTHNWTGNQNNNWDNGSNWKGASGFPNGTTDNAAFNDNDYGTNDREMDLRSGTFDINNLSMSAAGEPLTFRTGTLRLNGNMNFAVSLLGGTGTGHTFASDLTLVVIGDSTWQGGPQHRVTISGELQGTGNITTDIVQTAAKGSEIIRLNAANSYSGTLTINDGYVTIADTDSLQNVKVVLNWDNGLRMAGGIDANIDRLSGTGNLSIGGGLFKTDTSANSTFSGNLSGSSSGQFHKSGTGTLTLTGDISSIQQVANLGDGELVLDASSISVSDLVGDLGELTLQNGADANMGGSGIARSGSTGTLKVTGAGTKLRNGAELAAATGTGEGTINILSSAEVSDFDIVTAGRLGTGDISVQGNATLSATAMGLGGKDDLTNGGTGSLSVLTGGHVAIEGETRLWTNTSRLVVFADGTMATGTLTNPVGTSPTVELVEPSGGGAALTIGTDDAVAVSSFSGVIEDLSLTEPGTLAKTGANHAILAGNNTFTGGITLDGGTLGLAHSNAAGTGAISTLSGTTLDYSNGVHVANTIQPAANLNLNVSAGLAAIQSGSLSGDSAAITKIGDGSLTLSGSNTHGGDTSINAGSIVLGNANALQNSTVSINLNNGLNVNGINAILGGLSGTGDLNLGSTTLSVGNNDTSTSFSGLISGAGSLNKIGAGTLTLTGASTYAGGTYIEGGTLLANNTSGSATGTGSVVVNSGDTLGGTGSVAGDVTVNSGGNLAAGTSVGQLTVGSVDFESGSTYLVELVGDGGVAGIDFDQLVVTGEATLAGTLDVQLLNGFEPTLGDVFEILTASSGVSGAFLGESLPALSDPLLGWAIFYESDALLLAVTPALSGDFNADGVVNLADYTIWRDNLGAADEAALNGAGDGANGVNEGDYALWKSHFGDGVAAAAGAKTVPEPSALLLAIASIVTAICVTRRSC